MVIEFWTCMFPQSKVVYEFNITQTELSHYRGAGGKSGIVDTIPHLLLHY